MKKDQAQPSKRETESNDDGKPLDKFAELLHVMDSEQLLRFRKRLEKIGKKEMVKILTFEIKAKEAQERKEDDERRLKLEEQIRKDREGLR